MSELWENHIACKKSKNFHVLYRGDYFVVFLWDEAARYDEAFQEISLKMEVLEHGRDDTMGIHVIMDESVNASSSNVNQDHRYLMWFNEPGPKNMQALAEKIRSITQSKPSFRMDFNSAFLRIWCIDLYSFCYP